MWWTRSGQYTAPLPSTHGFTFNDAIAITTPHVTDPTPGNNSASTPWSVNVVGSADVQVTQSLVAPPTQMNVSAEQDVTLRKILRNNGGYGPVNVSITASARASPAAAPPRPSPTNPISATLPVNTDVTVDEAWTLHCTEPSTHTFTFNNSIAVSDAHVTDPTPGNNSASTSLTVDVIGSADVKIVEPVAGGPADSKSTPAHNVDVTLRKTLHNNGGYGPVNVSIAASAVAPSGCTATPKTNPTSASLPVSTDVTVDEVWTIHCTAPSTHGFTFNNAIAITTPHVTDPTPANNSASTPLSVDVIGSADVQVTQSLVSPPTQMNVSADAAGHPAQDSPQQRPLRAGQRQHHGRRGGAQRLHGHAQSHQPHLGQPAGEHRRDRRTRSGRSTAPSPAPTSSPSTTPSPSPTRTWSTRRRATTAPPHRSRVDVIAHADVKIVSQSLVDPPGAIGVSQNVDVTLRKTLHNNGPDGPVDVSISTSAIASPNCTATPSGSNPTSATLPVSTTVMVDEVWTLHCTTAGASSFTFNNVIAASDPHVVDPNSSNNTAQTPFTPEATALADVKIVSQALVSPPTEIDVSESVDITLRKTLHNNGPDGPADVSITAGVSVPAGCTATPSAHQPHHRPPCPSAATWLWTRSGPSTAPRRALTASPSTTASPSAIRSLEDPNPGNNSASTTWSVDVIGQADVKISDQTLLSPPATINASEQVNVTLRKTLHNNGSYGPANVSITASAVAPAGCTATPSGGNPTSVSLPVSTAMTVDEVWTIHCTEPSTHAFTFNNSIAPSDPHVVDLVPGNNSASTHAVGGRHRQRRREDRRPVDHRRARRAAHLPERARHAAQDSAQQRRLRPGERQHRLQRHGAQRLHGHAGPHQPHLSQPARQHGRHGGRSVDAPLHRAQHPHFHVQQQPSRSPTPHVVDPTPGNNSAETSLDVAVIANADVKISGQTLVSPPSTLNVSESVDVTLRKTLHNNGGYGPVDVSINASAVAPAGCTATPKTNPTSASLPVSTAVTVDEVWTLHCTAPSTHAFTLQQLHRHHRRRT